MVVNGYRKPVEEATKRPLMTGLCWPGILAVRVTRRDGSSYDLGAERMGPQRAKLR